MWQLSDSKGHSRELHEIACVGHVLRNGILSLGKDSLRGQRVARE